MDKPKEFAKVKLPTACQQMYQPGTKNIFTGVRLLPEHAFGFPTYAYNPNLLHYTNESILYPVGRRLACLDLITNKMSFIDIEVDHNTITAIECVTKKSSKIIFIAISSASQEFPSLLIFNIAKKRKSLMHLKECEKGSIIQQIIIPPNSKYCVLLVQSIKPLSSVMYIEYIEEKIILQSVLKQRVAMIAVNPLQSMQFVAVGTNYFRSYELVDKILKEDHLSIVGASYEKKYDFTCAQYCSNSNTIVAIAEPKSVFIIEEKTLKHFFHPKFKLRNLLIKHVNDEGTKLSDDASPEGKIEIPTEFKKEAITTHLKGLSTDDSKQKEFWKWLNGKPCINRLAVGSRLFAISTKYGAKIGIYEIGSDFSVDQIVMFSLPEDYTEVSKIVISSDESYITFLAKQYSKITYFNNLEKIEELDDSLFYSALRNNCFVINVLKLETIKDTLPVKEVIENGGPLGEITSIGVSLMKKLFVTVGTDHVIRAWDYEDSFKQIMCTEMQEQIFEISMHPMGLQFAVGQKEGLKVYYIMDTDFQLAAEVGGNSCYSVKYSHGGQYLAAASGSVISIIDPYTLEVKFALEGHASSITHLEWSDKDYCLVSSCKTNSVFCWHTKFELYQKEGNQPDYKIYLNGKGNVVGCTYDPEYDILVIVTTEGCIQCYNNRCTTPYCELIYQDIKPSTMLLLKSSNALLIGTITGIIRGLNWPIIKPKNAELVDFIDIPSHATSITQMAPSEDGKLLFTVGKDSLIYIYNVKQYLEGLEITPDFSRRHQVIIKSKQMVGKMPTAFSVNSLCLVQKTTLESKKQLIKSLKEEMLKQDEERMEEEKKKEKDHEEVMAGLREEHKKEIKSMMEEYEEAEKKTKEVNNIDIIEIVSMNNNLENEIAKMHVDYETKLKDEVDKYNKLQDLESQTKNRYYKEIEDIITKNKEVLQSIQAEYSTKYKELQNKHQNLANSIKQDGKKFKKILKQCEDEYEGEIQKLNINTHYSKHSEQAAKKRVEELDTKEEIDKRDAMKQKREDKAKADELTQKFNFQETTQIKLNEQLEKMREQLNKRENELKKKSDDINDIKESNKHLENFRFILDNKIKSLQEERISMESQIKQASENIKCMYNESIINSKVNKSLESKSLELSASVDKQKDEIDNKTEEALNLNQKAEMVQYDLLNLLKTTNYTEWPFLLRDIYSKHFVKDSEPQTNIPKQLYSKYDKAVTVEQRNEKLENLKLQNELLKQRDCVTEKLGNEVMRSEKLDKQRRELVVRLQKENVILIGECNKMRDENRQIAKRVAILEKKFREITGISLSHVDNIEQELDTFIRTSYTSHPSMTCKPTTFQKIKNQPKQTRMQSLVEYYGKFGEGEAPQKIKDLLIKNKEQIKQQNEEMKTIQEKVNKFLTNDITLPSISKKIDNSTMSQSRSQLLKNEQSLKKEEQQA